MTDHISETLLSLPRRRRALCGDPAAVARAKAALAPECDYFRALARLADIALAVHDRRHRHGGQTTEGLGRRLDLAVGHYRAAREVLER